MQEQLRVKIETQLLPYVQRPMRYTGGELNAVQKDLSKVSLHGVLCFPDLYDIGMSHTGLQILYHIINKEENWAMSRCFHPWLDAEALLRKEQIPLYTLEYFSPIRDADFIGFTVQYELHFTNILNMLDLAGIAPLKKDRSAHDPIIIAGGPVVGNPEPLADFIDAFVIGDGEQAITEVAKELEAAKKNHLAKKDLLPRLATIQGVYVPDLYIPEKTGIFWLSQSSAGKKVTAAKIPELLADHYPANPVVPLIEVIHKRLAVEVMRGCTRGCRFCSAGMYYRPVRERSVGNVTNTIYNGILATGWDEIGLLSLSTADYSAFSPLLEAMQQLKTAVSFSCSLPSTRVDALTPMQLDLLNAVSPASSCTIAPEAGSERLRRVINKDFTDEVIYTTVKELLKRKIQTIKLYFMLGLPTETGEDIAALITMIEKIAGMARASSGRVQVHVSLSPFSPKPHTPFQREKMATPEYLMVQGISIKKKVAYLKNVKASYRNPEQTVLETLLARGDRSVGALIYAVWQKGARFDGWDECFNMGRWRECARELSFDVTPFLNDLSLEEKLPWTVISTGVSESFLEEERKRAYEDLPTGDCRLECVGCGVCTGQLQPIFVEPPAITAEKAAVPVEAKKTPPSKVYHYRFHYKKTGIMRFLGHLDMVAVFHRAARMANYPLAYSQGYNPHPRIAFGPPLPFGVGGKREAFDAVLLYDFSNMDPRGINHWLPSGLIVDDITRINEKEPSLNATIMSAVYTFNPIEVIDLELLKKRIEELLSSDSWVITTEKKEQAIEKDIRKGIVSLASYSDGRGWRAQLMLNGTPSCKPSELLRVLLPEQLFSNVDITRENCFDYAGKEV